eukprot:1158419-Pelagomonas_calceolata.AAC.11
MQFSLDPKELDQCYKKLQWQYHPDKASLRPKQEQEWAAEHATAINHAYSTLKDPLARGTYMVSDRELEQLDKSAALFKDKLLGWHVYPRR